jgi:hypothetical protein
LIGVQNNFGEKLFLLLVLYVIGYKMPVLFSGGGSGTL